jgi:hypothetical protein
VDGLPPSRLDGLRLRDATVAGLTVKVAVCELPLKLAVTVAVV